VFRRGPVIGGPRQWPDAPFWLMLIVTATAGLGGGNFASSGQHFMLLPESRDGLGAGTQRGWRKYRRQRRSISDADPDRVRMGQSLYGLAARFGRAVLAERGAHVAATDRPRRVRRLSYVNNLTSALDAQGSADHRQEQAHLGDVLAVYRDLRLVYRLFGRVPAAAQDAVPGDYRGYRLPGTLSDPSRVRSAACSRIRWAARE
jgi:hypothetical protein